ncbi:hypothetical protein IC582_019717 [Cucumis melo]
MGVPLASPKDQMCSYEITRLCVFGSTIVLGKDKGRGKLTNNKK